MKLQLPAWLRMQEEPFYFENPAFDLPEETAALTYFTGTMNYHCWIGGAEFDSRAVEAIGEDLADYADELAECGPGTDPVCPIPGFWLAGRYPDHDGGVFFVFVGPNDFKQAWRLHAGRLRLWLRRLPGIWQYRERRSRQHLLQLIRNANTRKII